MQHTFDIVQTVAFLAAFIALASRLFVASRPFWSRFPAWAQTLLPVLVPTLTAAAQGLTGVRSWSDLSVLFVVSAGMLLPGLPSNRSAAPLQAGKDAKGAPSAGDVAVAQVVAKSSVRPAAVATPLPKPLLFPGDPPPPSFPGAAALLLAVCFAFHATACAAFAAAVSPYVAEAAVIISDAVNAIDAADALLPSLHLAADEQAKAEALIARLRAAASAAASADAGVKDLTAEQLNASLADFRAAWGELQTVFSAKKIGASPGSAALPKPLALRIVK